MLVNILIAAAAGVVLFLVLVAIRPAAYRIERTLEIAAPAALVFGVINDLKEFAGVFGRNVQVIIEAARFLARGGDEADEGFLQFCFLTGLGLEGGDDGDGFHARNSCSAVPF